MVAVVGAATLIRRGWKIALAHTAPLAGVFLFWYAAYGRDARPTSHASPFEAVTFTRTAIANAFRQLGQVSGMGFVLGAVLVVGVILVVIDMPAAELRRRCSATVALALGAVVFALTTGYGRGAVGEIGFAGEPRGPRYVHIIGAMLLPAIALGATAIARRWRPFLIVAVGIFLIGVPGNVDALYPVGLANSRSDMACGRCFSRSHVCPWRRRCRATCTRFLPASEVTVGWLVDAAEAGRLPRAGSVSLADRGSAELALSLRQLYRAPRGQMSTGGAEGSRGARGGSRDRAPRRVHDRAGDCRR